MKRISLILLVVFGLSVVAALYVIGPPDNPAAVSEDIADAPSCNGCDARHQRLKKTNLTQP